MAKFSVLIFFSILWIDSMFADEDIVLYPGWNMISLSQVPTDNSIQSVFKNHITNHVWIWDAENRLFRTTSEVLATRGHWVYCTAQNAVVIQIVGGESCQCEDDDLDNGIYRICNYLPLEPGNRWVYTNGDRTFLNETFTSGSGLTGVRFGTTTHEFEVFLHNCQEGLVMLAKYKRPEGGLSEFPSPVVLIAPEMVIGQTINQTLVEPDSADSNFRTTFIGTERISVPAGEFDTIKFEIDIEEVGECRFSSFLWFTKSVGIIKFDRVNPIPPSCNGCLFLCRPDNDFSIINKPSELTSALVNGINFKQPLADETDDFNDNTIDSEKWGEIEISLGDSRIWEPTGVVPAGTNFTERDQRLEFTNAGADLVCVRSWLKSAGGYTEDWWIQADIHIGNVTLPIDRHVDVGLFVWTGEFMTNLYFLTYDDSSFTGDYDRAFTVGGLSGGNFSISKESGNLFTEDAALRISFDSETKSLRAWFDKDGKTDGYVWTLLHEFHVESNDIGWNMSDTSQFMFSVGSSTGPDVHVAEGLIYLDNFQMGQM